jgi:ribonucleoside-diphosphate reductase alpha chain
VAGAREERVRSERLYELATEYGLDQDKLQVPERLFRSGRKMAQGFLQGLFTADGSVQGSVEKGVSVRLSSSDEQLLKETQQLLLNFGIYSKIYTGRREEGTRELPDSKGGMKEYSIEAQHDLVISKGSLQTFKEKIGFLREDKDQKLEEKLADYTRGPYQETFTATVETVEKDGHEDVYDLTEPETHSFIANGIVAHNCGEQPLENYEACNLGHINLSLMVEDKGDGIGLNFNEWRDKNSSEYDFSSQDGLERAMRDYMQEAIRIDELERVARIGTRFLDNVITMSNFPLDKIEETVRSLRKIGLGIMGFAQMLIQLGIGYGTEESFAAAKEIQRLVTRFAVEESHRLAEERGTFGEWEKSKWASPTEYREWFRRYSGGMDPEAHSDGLRVRNHNMVTIAPTGTTSMIADTSGGCEPIFSLAYFKNVGKDIQGEDMLVEFDDYFLRALTANGVGAEEVKEEAEQLMRNNEWEGVDSIDDDVLPPGVKKIFKTADRVTADQHVKIQAAFQEYNHSGISKTCNFPNDATREDIEEAYMLAYDLGCKGMTVYRDGSREVQVMTTRQDNKIEEKEPDQIVNEIEDAFGGFDEFLQHESVPAPATAGASSERSPRERPQIISGTTQKISTGYGGMYVTINEDQEGMFELFTQMGKSGGFTHSLTEAVSRLASLSLRSGVSAHKVKKQLEGIRSPRIAWDNSEQVLSIPDGVAKAMERYMNGEANQVQSDMSNFSAEKSATDKSEAERIVDSGKNPECPDCGGMLSYSEGCVKCNACGYSECG